MQQSYAVLLVKKMLRLNKQYLQFTVSGYLNILETVLLMTKKPNKLFKKMIY